MKSFRSRYQVLALVLLSALMFKIDTVCQGQTMALDLPEGGQCISLETGVDYAILPIMLSYQRADSLINRWNPIHSGLTVVVPAFNPDLQDLRVQAGLGTELFKHKRLLIGAQLSAFYIGTEMQTLSAKSLGLELGLQVSSSGEKFEYGVEVLWTSTLATNIQHTDKYRDLVYAEVQDGWYGATA